MGEWLGKRLELDVTNIAHGGVTVARLDGRVVFVSDAIPGERVIAVITDDAKSSFWRADTLEVLEASPYRQEHIWPEASLHREPTNRAGGAEFGHISLAHQRELKRQVLTDALHRMAQIDTEVVVEAVGNDDETGGTGWRTRVALHVDESGWPGPYAARSHRVVRVARLPLATPEINAVAPLTEQFASGTAIDLLSTGVGGGRLIVGAQKPTVISETVGERTFRLADSGFWQVHSSAAVTLSHAVREAIRPEFFDPLASNLDLYGGVGLLAAAMADGFSASTRVTTIESDAGATEFARQNLADLPNALAVGDRVERWLAREVANLDSARNSRIGGATVVLDPPRSGAGTGVIESLATLGPTQIIYVACDPVAFARDAGFLKERGYLLSRLVAFDLFPNTHHIEAVGTFLRE
jgi:tRNA/tmRNA/rRNA uracil-C5-methylase (TrmA/RlmC/RlmD family)